MRIVLCAASLDPVSGGPARSVPQLAGALADFGHDVGLWSPDLGPETLPDCAAAGAVRRFSGDLGQLINQFGRPDLVHDNGLWQPCHHRVARICGRLKIPRVASPRGMLEPWALRQKRFRKTLAWWFYQKRDLRSAWLLHATSSMELGQFRRLGLKRPAVVLPNGVALPKQIQKSEIGNRKSEIRTALFLSRLHPKKGLEMFVQAWAQVRPLGWRMRVVGPDEGGYRQKILKAVGRAGLSETWTFEDMALGPAKLQRLAEADLFVLPSFSENFGIVVAEALMAGVPVITTTATPWQRMLEHRCGWWVEPTVQGLAEGLRQAVNLPPAELGQMGQRGAVWARNAFTWPPIARTMIEAYRWTFEGGPKPACIV